MLQIATFVMVAVLFADFVYEKGAMFVALIKSKF